MEKLNGQSMNLTENNIDNLKQLFPEVFSEGKIDFDKLRLVLGDNIEENDERYQFTWNGKSEAIKNAQTPSMGTLRPDKESSKNWDNTENLYIKGDNLEVLKLLQKSYFGKVKMIYIDPPYNTGKDFVYKDNFRNSISNYKEMTNQTTRANAETSGRYHTDWLNMMYPRLKLARNLLREDGVIFISIDDNEVTNLKKLCDEIFGEDNFIDTLKWKKKKQPSFLATHTAKVMEYIHIYSKNKECLEKLSIEGTSDLTKKVINISNNKSKRHFNKGVRVKGEANQVIKAGVYTIKTMSIEYKQDIIVENNYTVNDIDVEANFSVSQEKIDEFIKNDLLFITAQKGLRRDVSLEEMGKRKSITDLLLNEWGDNQESDKEFLDIFESKYFDYIKPIKLIKNLIKSNFTENEIILDFFSGSSTTAHAVMQLNAEDNGKRKFIMVQLPETTDEKSEAYKVGYSNICEIGKERIRRAGDKVVSESGKTDLDIGFKVFKLEDSNIKEWNPNYDDLEFTLDEMTDNLKNGRTKEDLLFEILIKMGIELTAPIEEINIGDKTIYNIGMGSLVLCLEDEITEEIIKEIPKYKSDFVDMKVVFKETGFRADSQKMNAMQNLKQFGINDVRSI